jgi:flavin reductase (DIM6/NTAB) family NADH-FMN oxidoreductase RutF/pimeloyl-ACP methyl ester carboxylesterase
MLTYAGFGGLKLAADTFGSPENPAAVLIHGGAQTRHSWHEAAKALAAAGRYAITLDLRGHGDSPFTKDASNDMEAYVGDLRAVLAQLPTRPVLIGAAMGGMIALAALGDGGESLASGLVLVDAAPWMDTAHFIGNLDPTVLQALESSIGKLTVPTLMVRGRDSQVLTAAEIERFRLLAPNAEFADIEAAGNLGASERSDAFNALLLEFLERRVPREPIFYEVGSDPRTLRDALGCFGTGIIIATARDANGGPQGLTANSFTSVSLDPPLILFCIAKSSKSLDAFVHSTTFAVNVLHIGQQPASSRFAKRDEDRFGLTAWEVWDTGAPIITGSLASFECDKHGWYDAGDHYIVVGKVLRARYEPQRDPLIYFRGKYRRLHMG